MGFNRMKMRCLLLKILILYCVGSVANENNSSIKSAGNPEFSRHPSHNYMTNASRKGITSNSQVTEQKGESQTYTTWIFVDKPQKAEQNEKLQRVANWVNQATVPPAVNDSPRYSTMQNSPLTTKRQEHGSWQNQEDDGEMVGTTKAPGCAQYGRYYCSYKEDYPIEVVSQVIKYMKWPLEKLFRDLRIQKFPKIADNADGGLVCDSITRIIRPGWAKNNNGRWVVIINTESYAQYVTEIICRYDDSYCNFVPPCYQATCQQRYNTQTLLAIDPYNPYKGPFLSKFLFPSCCVCYVPKVKYDKPGVDF